ncbi:MAG: ThuA domain-containing protein [Bacteroidota bacterium]
MKRLLYWLGTSLLMAFVAIFFTACEPTRSETRILVFSKTDGYRHASIEPGKLALMAMGEREGFLVDTTEDASLFVEEKLAQYSAVVFLNTTHDVLDHRQQADFERYIQAGGGFVGIHAAADTEYDWPWYGRLVGAYFASHPEVQEGAWTIQNASHPSTQFLGQKAVWQRKDEFYDFKNIHIGEDVEEPIIPLITIDEKSYSGGKNGDFHPVAWYHDFDGGRSWYTNAGHTPETFTDDKFLNHLLGGIRYAIGANLELDYSACHSLRVPEENRFVIEVLDDGLDEPMEIEVLRDGRILYTTRKGTLNLFDPETRKNKVVGKLDVYTKKEDGLVGIALDPNFYENHWIYLYYAPNVPESIFQLSRFVFTQDSLILASEKVLLEVPVQRQECCHTGGSIQFGPDGLLYLSTGDNTNPFETRYAPINELPERGPWDAQKSSANTQDLRGKILRIRPTKYGTYEIPEGNLFPKDGSVGRPEIYVMGCRNPYRISIDQKTKFLYWGDVGPDANTDSTRGPAGHDEVNQARQPGFFGWPLFVADNKAYQEVDFATGEYLGFFDPEKPINNSPNNTGAQQLPPAQKAFIYYPYAETEVFPHMGKGGRNAMAGPVFYADQFEEAASHFPAYYEGKLFIYDFSRDWVNVVTMDENGDLETIEPFLSALNLSSPMDMEFGPDGALYILEYGTRWFAANKDARLVRIDYSEGNRPPRAVAKADKTSGAAPLTVTFDGGSSVDLDQDDALSYTWQFPDGEEAQGVSASKTFERAGVYEVVLQVKDQGGKTASHLLEIQVGNDYPAVDIEVAGNRSYFWEDLPIPYVVKVSDTEDGSLADGGISAEAVAISFDLLEGSQDPTLQAQGHAAATASAQIANGLDMITEHGCIACHELQAKNVGPAYVKVAEKYASQADAETYLVNKIIQGGSGVWGGKAMPAQSQLSEEQALAMTRYILSIKPETGQTASLSPKGTLNMDQHETESAVYTMQATYVDRGGAVIGPLSNQASVSWRSPRIYAMERDELQSAEYGTPDAEGGFKVIEFNPNGYIIMPSGDLNGVGSLSLRYASSRAHTLIVRLDGPEGKVLTEIDLTSTGDQETYKVQQLVLPTTEGMHSLCLQLKESPDHYGRRGKLRLHWLYLHPNQAISALP